MRSLGKHLKVSSLLWPKIKREEQVRDGNFIGFCALREMKSLKHYEKLLITFEALKEKFLCLKTCVSFTCNWIHERYVYDEEGRSLSEE